MSNSRHQDNHALATAKSQKEKSVFKQIMVDLPVATLGISYSLLKYLVAHPKQSLMLGLLLSTPPVATSRSLTTNTKVNDKIQDLFPANQEPYRYLPSSDIVSIQLAIDNDDLSHIDNQEMDNYLKNVTALNVLWLHAAESGKINILKFLYGNKDKYGLDIWKLALIDKNIISRRGLNSNHDALSLACYYGHKNIVAYLLKNILYEHSHAQNDLALNCYTLAAVYKHESLFPILKNHIENEEHTANAIGHLAISLREMYAEGRASGPDYLALADGFTTMVKNHHPTQAIIIPHTNKGEERLDGLLTYAIRWLSAKEVNTILQYQNYYYMYYVNQMMTTHLPPIVDAFESKNAAMISDFIEYGYNPYEKFYYRNAIRISLTDLVKNYFYTKSISVHKKMFFDALNKLHHTKLLLVKAANKYLQDNIDKLEEELETTTRSPHITELKKKKKRYQATIEKNLKEGSTVLFPKIKENNKDRKNAVKNNTGYVYGMLGMITGLIGGGLGYKHWQAPAAKSVEALAAEEKSNPENPRPIKKPRIARPTPLINATIATAPSPVNEDNKEDKAEDKAKNKAQAALAATVEAIPEVRIIRAAKISAKDKQKQAYEESQRLKEALRLQLEEENNRKKEAKLETERLKKIEREAKEQENLRLQAEQKKNEKTRKEQEIRDIAEKERRRKEEEILKKLMHPPSAILQKIAQSKSRVEEKKHRREHRQELSAGEYLNYVEHHIKSIGVSLALNEDPSSDYYSLYRLNKHLSLLYHIHRCSLALYLHKSKRDRRTEEGEIARRFRSMFVHGGAMEENETPVVNTAEALQHTLLPKMAEIAKESKDKGILIHLSELRDLAGPVDKQKALALISTPLYDICQKLHTEKLPAHLDNYTDQEDDVLYYDWVMYTIFPLINRIADHLLKPGPHFTSNTNKLRELYPTHLDALKMLMLFCGEYYNTARKERFKNGTFKATEGKWSLLTILRKMNDYRHQIAHEFPDVQDAEIVALCTDIRHINPDLTILQQAGFNFSFTKKKEMLHFAITRPEGCRPSLTMFNQAAAPRNTVTRPVDMKEEGGGVVALGGKVGFKLTK